MVKQVEYINRPDQSAVFEHDQFFHDVRHGFKRCQQHENSDHDENRVGNFIEQCPHTHPDMLKVFSQFDFRYEKLKQGAENISQAPILRIIYNNCYDYIVLQSKNQRAMSNFARPRPPIQRLIILLSLQCFSI